MQDEIRDELENFLAEDLLLGLGNIRMSLVRIDDGGPPPVGGEITQGIKRLDAQLAWLEERANNVYSRLHGNGGTVSPGVATVGDGGHMGPPVDDAPDNAEPAAKAAPAARQITRPRKIGGLPPSWLNDAGETPDLGGPTDTVSSGEHEDDSPAPDPASVYVLEGGSIPDPDPDSGGAPDIGDASPEMDPAIAQPTSHATPTPELRSIPAELAAVPDTRLERADHAIDDQASEGWDPDKGATEEVFDDATPGEPEAAPAGPDAEPMTQFVADPAPEPDPAADTVAPPDPDPVDAIGGPPEVLAEVQAPADVPAPDIPATPALAPSPAPVADARIGEVVNDPEPMPNAAIHSGTEPDSGLAQQGMAPELAAERMAEPAELHADDATGPGETGLAGFAPEADAGGDEFPAGT